MNTKLIAVELHVKVGALALLSSEPLPDPARAYWSINQASFLYALKVMFYLGIIFDDIARHLDLPYPNEKTAS